MAVTEEQKDHQQELPRWDVTDIYPSLTSRQFAAAREQLGASITRLGALYDGHDVRGGEGKTANEPTVRAFEEVVEATNAMQEAVRTLAGYITSYLSADARDDVAQAERSGLQLDLATLSKLRTRLDAWVAAVGVDDLVAASPVAADHAFPLQRAALRAAHQMSEAEEALLADLSLTGSSAWNRLHTDVTARLLVELDARPTPMAAVRGLATDPDADVRRRAYDAELAAWEANAVPCAAALNAIKGESHTINTRRGWADDLEPALAANNVDRATLDAMQRAAVASFPDFRRYLKAKAALLGSTSPANGGLPWYDLFAPVSGVQGPAPTVSWDEAIASVTDVFGTYSPALRGLAERATNEAWIDAAPREGKAGGAFCMGLVDDRSLVSLNFNGSFDGVQTLAHELGHAYHNTTLASRTPLQRQTPMALAETASIFCETLMVERGLASADPAARLSILETDLQGSCQVVVDIHSRFLFESAVYSGRAKRNLSVAELNAAMSEAQEQTYGDGLDPELRHPWMWAVKPHYYGSAFYNWPYCFGLLFGIGLYARYDDDPERFRGGYDDLLSSTGLGDAATLAARFGIDVTDEAFWTASLDVVRGRIDEFERLAAEIA